jgi:hypothetical protein
VKKLEKEFKAKVIDIEVIKFVPEDEPEPENDTD